MVGKDRLWRADMDGRSADSFVVVQIDKTGGCPEIRQSRQPGGTAFFPSNGRSWCQTPGISTTGCRWSGSTNGTASFSSIRTIPSLERNAGANSGNVYQTVVEADSTEIHVGEFTRVIGADAVPQATPTRLSTSTVAFSISPAANVGPAAASLNPSVAPHQINLDAVNTAPGVQVVNASGFCFHSLTIDTYKVTGTGSQTNATETVSIKVKDVGVQVKTDTFVCQDQTIRVTDGDSNATYTIRLTTNNTGATVTDPTYTAGPTAGTDTIEVVATYDAAKGVFSKYGDNGLAAHRIRREDHRHQREGAEHHAGYGRGVRRRHRQVHHRSSAAIRSHDHQRGRNSVQSGQEAVHRRKGPDCRRHH